MLSRDIQEEQNFKSSKAQGNISLRSFLWLWDWRCNVDGFKKKGMGDFDSMPGNKSLQYFKCLEGDSPERET